MSSDTRFRMVDLYLGEPQRANRYCEQVENHVICFHPEVTQGITLHLRLTHIPVPAGYRAESYTEDFFDTIVIDSEDENKVRFLINSWKHAARNLIVPDMTGIADAYEGLEVTSKGGVIYARKVGLCLKR